ncbi:hypothetical protein SAMN05443639_111190 [Stigmatella erecta]|uniref:Uncharacterized protein n=2 Tax=Stigmatella erecta TaxID=83460 RepID=A0A1I0KJZ3_9BACT|nr:hypothetical protein SAMN05443639_111190 [Stigmatella erecta]
MKTMRNKLMKSAVILAVAVGFGTGCGGTSEEPEFAPDLETAGQEAVAEEPRKIEDLSAVFDDEEGVLHVVDTEQDTVLKQLGATQVDSTSYEAINRPTGEKLFFTLKPSPISVWPRLFTRCPNGQYVLNGRPCPKLELQTPNLQVWKNSSCSQRIQAAGTSACVTSSVTGTSYKYQYLESWKCGVGTGYCVNWKSIQSLRYNYNLAACGGNPVSISQTANYLCAR